MACQGENLVVLNLKLLFAMFSESSGRIATAKKWALWLGGKRNYSLNQEGLSQECASLVGWLAGWLVGSSRPSQLNKDKNNH
jgi:hypothetical protein